MATLLVDVVVQALTASAASASKLVVVRIGVMGMAEI
jgi:hypothetical protein